MKHPPHLIEPPAVHTAILGGYHTVIAGKTGSGKSVVLDGLIATLLSEYTPDDVSIYIGDPKRVDFKQYKKASHVVKYADTVAGIIQILDDTIKLMDRRYRIMQLQGIKKWKGRRVILIIDEIADLMLSDQKKAVTLKLAKLLQLARASNITVILATQVIRAEILPARITGNAQGLALQTKNALESRMIIQEAGAETLPKYGQCIYNTVDGVKNFDVPMIEESDIIDLIKYWNKPIWRRLKK